MAQRQKEMKILRFLKGWPWYYWLVIVAVPGGLFLVALMGRKKSAVASGQPDYGVAARSRLDVLLGGAKDAANQLRSGLVGDPLAANLLGVNPDLLKASEPATIADNELERASLQADLDAYTGRLNNATHYWPIDHFGGQSPEQYQGIIDDYSSHIAQLRDKLAALLS
jgi:hypothetical protein